MLNNFIIPTIFICLSSSPTCNESNAVDKIILEAVSTPENCWIAGMEKQVEYSQQHSEEKFQFVIKCDNPNRQKT
jgi:hypothetical protein